MPTQNTGYTDTHAAAGLDTKFPSIDTWANQFRADFGRLTIRYMPRDLCMELKSLKEYLFTYRNLGIFQENIVNQVLDDVVKSCNPVWAKVVGDFRPRGGISTIVEASYPRPDVK
jgi:7-cyano-7-deazaguanine reductase